MVANKKLKQTPPDPAKLPGAWFPKTDILPEIPKYRPDDKILTFSELHIPDTSDTAADVIHVHKGVFTEAECNELIEMFANSGIESPVSVQGNMSVLDNRVGSHRATAWSEKLAEMFYHRMGHLFNTIIPTNKTSTDWWQDMPTDARRLWKPMGVSPLLRFMRYEEGGEHYAHYDAGYVYDDTYRTLKSFVVYLTTNDSGYTSFVKDDQHKKPVWERNHFDWTREATEDEIYFRSKPVKGNVLVFNHRLCHMVEKYTGPGPRIIIRGDVIYRHVK